MLDGTPPTNPKVTASALGTALATIAVFVAVKVGVDFTAEEAVAITGALAVVVGWVAGRQTAGPVWPEEAPAEPEPLDEPESYTKPAATG